MTKERTEPVRKPAGWCEAEVKNALKIIDYRGRTPPYSPDGIPHLRSSNIRDGKIVWEDLKYVSQEIYDLYMTRGLPEKDDVLFTTEAPLGEVALAPNQKFSLAQRMMILKPPRNAILPKFLMYQIQSGGFQRKIGNVGTGTTVSGISSRNFKPIPLLIAPLPEQQRIVDKIEELFSDLDSGINSLKTAQQQLKVYRQAVLKWAFEGKLTAQWREEQQRQGKLASADTLLAQIKAERDRRYQKELEAWQSEVEAWEAIGKEGKKPRKPSQLKEFRELTDTDLAALPDLPEHWFYIRAEGISDFITKGTTPKKGELFELEGDIPFIKVYNLTHRGTLNFSINPTFVSYETHRGFLGRSKVLPGDVLINIVGPPLGKVSLIPDTFKEWNINQAVARYRLLDSVLNKYFTYYLLSQFTVNMMSARAKATAGQFNLTLEICRDVEIPVCSKAEQEKIVEEIESRLSICDQLEADIEANLQKAEALRQSILKQAFEGKLVPQDPNDEPAAVLLERIRAEREAEKGNGKGKGKTRADGKKRNPQSGEQIPLNLST